MLEALDLLSCSYEVISQIENFANSGHNIYDQDYIIKFANIIYNERCGSFQMSVCRKKEGTRCIGSVFCVDLDSEPYNVASADWLRLFLLT